MYFHYKKEQEMVTAEEKEELFYRLALLSAGYIGDRGFKTLFRALGSAKEVYKSPVARLKQVEGVGDAKIKALQQKIDEKRILKEIDFLEKKKITIHFLFDETYPEKLKQLPDAPVMLFSRGHFDIHHPRQIAIVGTRNNSEYGRQFTLDLIDQLKPYNVQVISGLAYGIDIIAHRHCVERQIETVAVLAHGMDQVYPAAHKDVAQSMLDRGGLITEFLTGSGPDRHNFPMRNRIVAGMADMTLVVESRIKGGALITAKLAASYNREVGAVPGRIKDERSEGCHYLIKKNIAYLIESAADIEEILGWDVQQKQAAQSKLFLQLSQEEQTVVDILKQKESMHIDELMLRCNLNYSHLASVLLSLELQDIVKAMSGKRYRISYFFN